jgi:ribosomal protein S18 acetylase RimI-like enzyme
MSANTKIVVRNAREQDISAVAEIDAEAFPPYGTAEKPETFQRRLTSFPNGFIILVADNEIAAYGYSEKWLTERQPGLEETQLTTHHPEGSIFCILSMAVKMKYRGRGYGLLVLNKLIETAHLEVCKKIVLETTQAQGFFLKRGFKTVQHRMERGITLETMSLDLEPISRSA